MQVAVIACRPSSLSHQWHSPGGRRIGRDHCSCAKRWQLVRSRGPSVLCLNGHAAEGCEPTMRRSCCC